MSKDVLFKQIRSEGGCNSFIFADLHSKKACVIDPRVDEQDIYATFADIHKLSIAFVIDTHTHADHYSGSHLLAKEFGAHIAMSAATASARADIRLTDGQEIELSSNLGVRALHTPGHTPDSVSLVVTFDKSNAVFTGDTLFIGGSGRTDFPGASAEDQYESIYRKLGGLNTSTWVFPGHDYSGFLFSTIEAEKRLNPHWLFQSKEEFIQAKNLELLDSPGILQNIVDFNLNAKPTSRPRGCGAATMCATAVVQPTTTMSRKSASDLNKEIAEVGSAASQKMLVIDVREPEEYLRGRIPGVRNIPLSELFLHWSELKQAQSIVFTCQSGNRSRLAAHSALRAGLTQVSDLEGGFQAWTRAGHPVET